MKYAFGVRVRKFLNFMLTQQRVEINSIKCLTITNIKSLNNIKSYNN